MQVTFTRDAKERKSTSAVYVSDTVRGSVRISKTAFVNGEAPAEISLDAPFTPLRAKETKEERKARLAALPKLTTAQKAEKLRKRLAKLEAKAAQENASSAA